MTTFNNQVAVVTGAASGIGAATCKLLLARGASVVGIDLQETLQKVESQAEQTSAKYHSVICDVGDRNSVEHSINGVRSLFGRLDILVNCAGITARHVTDTDDFEVVWDAVMRVNLKGSLLMSHAAAEAMKQNDPPGGAIVNLGSIMSNVVYQHQFGLSDGFNPYPHSKGGVLQLTRDLAVQLAKSGIRANTVCPGFIDTSLTESLQQNHELFQHLRDRHPLGRFGTADEVAKVIVFLASHDASFVTGAAWAVDGGYLAS